MIFFKYIPLKIEKLDYTESLCFDSIAMFLELESDVQQNR